ncbi:YecA family protein [Pseudogracilibacillus sp. SO30301A]|uniref:YecA family protein n=1 Tax=Pseudogracilibacillus sp. SO30301A TaxID=3098291 RepID=UPI00300E5F52
MVKIGRNDKCHCGSGKKYKKCCLDKDAQLNINQVVHNPVTRWLTYEEVNAMSTDEIVYKLGEVGISFNREEFLEDMKKFYSAEEISDNWFQHNTVTVKGRNEDFPWMAAWILWERLAPSNHLSMEQMSDLSDRGFGYLAKNDPVSACDAWLKVWEVIKDRSESEFQTLDHLDEHYEGSFYIRDFCQDLEMELHNAGLNNPAYFEKRIVYCREFCDIFPKEDEQIIHNMRRAIAASYKELGEHMKADFEFEKLVKDFPNNPWGYIGWGGYVLPWTREGLS